MKLIHAFPFAAALLLPYRHFIPALWLCAFIGYGIIVYYLGSILLVSRSRIAMWFAGSLVVTAVAILMINHTPRLSMVTAVLALVAATPALFRILALLLFQGAPGRDSIFGNGFEL